MVRKQRIAQESAEFPKRCVPRAKLQKDGFKTAAIVGESLRNQVTLVEGFRRRKCFEEIRSYVLGPSVDKVLVLYGLWKTGKTTMIRQMLSELPDGAFQKAAFLQISSGDTLAGVNGDLRLLESLGYQYIFIDEVTLMEDFVEGAALFSDIFAASGMKVVLSGTDSLGFAITRQEQLYDRCIMVHTTFIPYREFEEVLGIKGIDEYIRYGGTMSLSGTHYNRQNPFSTAETTNEYIDTAIAKNIQHSLKAYEYGSHFRHLEDLYEKGELTNGINRVVEDLNHRFTRSIIEKTFKSHDLAVTASNHLRDREQPINIYDHLDVETVTEGIKTMLEILDKEEQSVSIEEAHMVEIEEYLRLLDLVEYIDLETLPVANRKRHLNVITQPGLRYAQAKVVVENLMEDAGLQKLDVKERKRILERLLSEVKGRMMEEIVLLETKLAFPEKMVFKLQFPIGEFDMVIFDPEVLTCAIYEIKYSKEVVPEQHRFLDSEEYRQMTTHRYGDIVGKYVIYRGPHVIDGEVEYLNVEEYLTQLGRDNRS